MSNFQKFFANFQFFLQNLSILKFFVNKNGIKNPSPSKKIHLKIKKL